MTRLAYLKRQLAELSLIIEIPYETYYDQFQETLSVQLAGEEDIQFDDVKHLRHHINVSAFLIGFTHFEGFVTDIVKDIYRTELLETGRYANQITLDKTVDDLLYAECRDWNRKIAFLKDHFGGMNSFWYTEFLDINKIRNCLIHNNGKANYSLKERYADDEEISFTKKDIHLFL